MLGIFQKTLRALPQLEDLDLNLAQIPDFSMNGVLDTILEACFNREKKLK